MGADRVLSGLSRAFHFVRLVMPILLHYKLKQLLNRMIGRTVPDKEWEDMHSYWAPRCLAIAERMQGFYIKVGQHLATCGLNTLPVIYVDYFTTLLEHCPSQPFSTVKHIVEKELGPLARTFEIFDELPMNAASTGQVHCAKLWGGHEVVVKVQHPDAEWTFGVDLQLFVMTAELFQVPGSDIVRQVQDNLQNEFDYEREAAQQREAAMHLTGFPNIVVPLPVDRLHPQTPIPGGLCTKRVLVMDRLYGTSLADWGRAQLESEARCQGKTRKELQDELMKRPSDDLENMRPSAVFLAAYFMAIRSVDLACNTPLFAYNWGLGYALGQPLEYVDTPLPPNIHHITDELLAAQAHLIFQAGFVNADPHAGNVMLLTDGRIALIDWGQVVRLTVDQRCLLAGLYIAVADGDDPMSADCMRTLGGKTAHDWDWTQAQWAKIANWSLKELEDNNCKKLSEVMDQVDATTKEAESVFVMTFKNQLYTRQVAAMLGFPGINSAVALRGDAEACLRMAGWPVPQTRCIHIPMPPEAQDLMSSDSVPQAPAKAEEDGSGLTYADKLPLVAPRKRLFLVAACGVLCTYCVCSALKHVQAPPALGGSALLVTSALGAAFMTPALRSYLSSCIGQATFSEPGDPGSGHFGAGGWELDCESRREGNIRASRAGGGRLLLSCASMPLPILLALGLLPALLGRLAAQGSALRRRLAAVTLAFVLVYNACLMLHLVRKAAAKRSTAAPDAASAASLGLALVAVYAVQHWTLAAIQADAWSWDFAGGLLSP
mmetsp:Transcript_95928/g.280387  ORF Transcript_95928/g.280387 Transcript_95928/m.280387 type:complete len:774 (+) Transcript_95928:117-2438(+)